VPGLGPTTFDVFNPYDGYAPMAQFFLEGFPTGTASNAAMPSRSTRAISGSRDRTRSARAAAISGPGALRTAMYTDSIEQLRGTAGARQVRVRAETALAAFTHSKQWRLDHVRQTPEADGL